MIDVYKRQVMNIANPKVMRSQEVPLEILNGDILESSGKTYEVIGDRDTVTVYYKVTTSDSANIKASDFRAYIDLADVYEPTGAVPVKLEVKNNSNKLESVVSKPSVCLLYTSVDYAGAYIDRGNPLLWLQAGRQLPDCTNATGVLV